MSTERPSDAVLLVLSAVALSNRYEVPVNTAIEWLRAADWPKDRAAQRDRLPTGPP